MTILWELFYTFFYIGITTFGGGYAMLAILEHEFVESKKWTDKEDFLNMIAIAESTPGPIAINSATYLGYKKAVFRTVAGSRFCLDENGNLSLTSCGIKLNRRPFSMYHSLEGDTAPERDFYFAFAFD